MKRVHQLLKLRRLNDDRDDVSVINDLEPSTSFMYIVYRFIENRPHLLFEIRAAKSEHIRHNSVEHELVILAQVSARKGGHSFLEERSRPGDVASEHGQERFVNLELVASIPVAACLHQATSVCQHFLQRLNILFSE